MSHNSGQDRRAPQIITVDKDYEGQRIDNFLRTCLKGVPKSLIYRILRKGEVRVNKGRIKPEYRLQAGDKVRIPPIRVSETEAVRQPGQKLLQDLTTRILYEDNDLIIINKPSGVAVHGGSGISCGIIEAVRQLYPQARHLELVHRLDRDTSGCLMLAKKRSILRQLHGKLREHGINKHYLALLMGRLTGGRRKVDLPLQKNILRSGERIVTVHDEGKEAMSVFEPITTYKMASLAGIQLKTGRTHQIRVHAAAIGHPVAGDTKYGDENFNNAMRALGLKRLFLHARSLDFEHPGTGRAVTITAPLDDDLEAVLEKLEK